MNPTRRAILASTKGKAVHLLKARAIKNAFDRHPGRNLEGILKLKGISISRVEVDEDQGCIEVWTGKSSGQPQYRIFNPPTLVRDSRGDIELKGNGKFREDPMSALVEVLLA